MSPGASRVKSRRMMLTSVSTMGGGLQRCRGAEVQDVSVRPLEARLLFQF